jgi:hypothetical protein
MPAKVAAGLKRNEARPVTVRDMRHFGVLFFFVALLAVGLVLASVVQRGVGYAIALVALIATLLQYWRIYS